MLLTDEGEPESFEEAKEDTHSRKWLSAMQDEMDSLHENHTFEQAPRQWYRKFDSFMTDQGYHKTQADHCVFVKKFEGGDFLILLLYS